MAQGPPLVMVVDDDAAVRDALQFVLRVEGVDVRTHADGPALLASLELPGAACLILKENLPLMGGCEVLRQVRARNLSPWAILLTGTVTPALRMRAEAVGVWLILEKPLMDNRLVDAVLGVLRKDGPPELRKTH
jgi:FixJ family two-component response regulator